MRTVETKIYKYHELSDTAKEKAREWASECVANHDWWDSTYEDAKNIGLKITGFELDRNRHAKGEFITDWHICAQKIVSEHGPDCATRKTAQKYIDASRLIKHESENENYEDEMADLEKEYLKELLQDYSIMLQYGYESFFEEEYLKDFIEANEYEFTEDGRRYV